MASVSKAMLQQLNEMEAPLRHGFVPGPDLLLAYLDSLRQAAVAVGEMEQVIATRLAPPSCRSPVPPSHPDPVAIPPIPADAVSLHSTPSVVEGADAPMPAGATRPANVVAFIPRRSA